MTTFLHITHAKNPMGLPARQKMSDPCIHDINLLGSLRWKKNTWYEKHHQEGRSFNIFVYNDSYPMIVI